MASEFVFLWDSSLCVSLYLYVFLNALLCLLFFCVFAVWLVGFVLVQSDFVLSYFIYLLLLFRFMFVF